MKLFIVNRITVYVYHLQICNIIMSFQLKITNCQLINQLINHHIKSTKDLQIIPWRAEPLYDNIYLYFLRFL